MTEEPNPIVETLSAFAAVLTEIKDASIEIMRVHPVNGLLMMNLLGNIGYAMFAVPDEEGQFMIAQWGLAGALGAAVRFDSRQELMSYIFRQTAAHSGALLQQETLSDMFSMFNMGKLLEALK